MASLDNIAELRSIATDIESYEALYAETTEYSAVLIAKEKALAEREAAAKAKIEDLKAKIAEAKANKEKQRAQAASAATIYQRHIEQCAALFNDLILRKAAFTYIAELIEGSADAASGGAANLKFANLGHAQKFQETWATFDSALDKRIADLSVAAESEPSIKAGDINPLPDLEALVEAVRDLHATVSGPLIREISRRNNHAANVQQLRESQSQLMLWCRQQRSTMEGLTEAGQIQEYTNSFQSNITVMETNFLVLMELAEPLLPNKEVNAMLEEVIEVWLSLQVFAFEKLTATLMAQHEASGIEADLSRWLEHEGNIVLFLNKAREVLTMPVDDESREVTQPILDQCEKLLADVESFNIIASHLSSFTLREANLKEYYDAIRRTIFSKLTISTQVYNGQYAFPKKQSYMDRLAELNDWVDCKSQNSAWKQLLQRVDNMKGLIEENKATHGTAEERGY